MESMIHRMKSRGTTLDTDASSATRLSQRPKPTRGTGATFEDFGTSFGKRSSQTSVAAASRRPSRQPGPGSSSRGVAIRFNSDGESSDDEINFLSGSSRNGSESPKKPRRIGKRVTSTARSLEASPSPTVTLAIDRHQADPSYKPIDFTKMSFRKNKKSDTSLSQTLESSQESRPKEFQASSSSSRPTRPPSLPNDIIDLSNTPKKKKALPLRERTPNQDRPRSRRPSPPPPRERGDARKEQDKDADKTPRASRVAPRPVNKGNRNSLGKSQTVPDLRPGSQEKGRERSQPISRSQSTHELVGTHSAPINVSEDDSDGVKTDVPRRKANNKTQVTGKGRQGPAARADRDINPYPNMSPLSSQTALRERERTYDKSKGKQREDPISTLLKSPSFRKRKDDSVAFPMPSPLSSPPSRSGSPSLPPPSSTTRNKLPPVRKNVIMSSEEDEEDERPLAPFPMATQDLESLRRASPAVKRTTPDSGMEGDGGIYKKKRRRDSEKFSLDFGSDSDEDMFLNPAIDPKTLCPWCDEPLPSEPTPHLRALIAAAKRVSRRDDRITNPLGLRAPLTAFVGVCQRHRFERNWVPRARKRGWPTMIDWDALSGRIARLRRHLQAIVDDVDEEFAPEVAGAGAGASGSRRPRKENEFWVEVVKNVRQQGSRQTAGVRGQFQHFNKTQPGYYGELGYVIIHQTLCDMFPPADFHPDATLPVTPPDFITLVLVPEAALRLIAEDLALPRDKAIETLRESVEYGVAMFPADEEDGQGIHDGAGDAGALGAGEQMFMERARARRKELEVEERMEEEEEAARMAARPKPRPRPRAKTKAPGASDAETDGGSVERASSPPSALKPKPKSKRKAPSRASSRARSTSREPGESVIVLTSDTSESDASSVGPSKRRRKVRGTASTKTSDIEMDGVEATPKPKSKPRPRPVPRPVTTAAAISPPDEDEDEDEQRLDAENPPVSSSSSTRDTTFVSWSRKGKTQISKAGTEITIDTTPRAKPRRSDTLTAFPLSNLSPPAADAEEDKVDDAPGVGSMCPLQVARERRRREREQEQEQAARPPSSSPKTKRPQRWHSSLRDGNADSSTDDEALQPHHTQASRSVHTSTSSPAKPEKSRGSVFGQGAGRTDSFGWLLNSDDSQSRAGSPQNFFQPSYYDD